MLFANSVDFRTAEWREFRRINQGKPMKLERILGIVLLAPLVCTFAFGDDAPPDNAKPEPKIDAKSDARNVRIIKPFSELNDLTPEQTQKLREIHKKYLEQIKAIELQQRQELMSVLT